ncbi:YfjI family protein [uncultured Methylophaga sp.]|uniref:YfjI family protein n=1 Tax=uncultured Methylophaga sp. TaxID=285271 RepID=UPI0030FA81B5
MHSFKEKSDEFPYMDWGEPNPIVTTIPSVMSMTEELMPDALKDWLVDVSHRMQTPADFSTISAIVVFSSVIGSGCGIRPKQEDDWEVIPNLWGACIGQPSVVLKTPSMQEAMRMLENIQTKHGEKFESEKGFHKAEELQREFEKKELEGEIKKLSKRSGIPGSPEADAMAVLKYDYAELYKKSEESPKRRLFKTNETSIQSMTLIQEQNERGLLVFRDELTGLLVRWDREEHADERAYFLEGWNGNGSYTDMKISRGLTEASNICISLLGGIQPDKLKRYLYQATQGNNDGLLQRLQLAVWPEIPKGWELVDRKPYKAAKDKVQEILEKLSEINFRDIGAWADDDESRPYFRFNMQAQSIFNNWLTRLQKEKIGTEDNPLMLEHFGKYRSLMPSLALIFHCLDCIDKGFKGSIGPSSADLAVKLCEYLESHARKIYAVAEKPEVAAAIKLCGKIKEKTLPSPFTAKNVYNKGWFGLKNRSEVEAACSLLVDEGWLKSHLSHSATNGGRPPLPSYYINPIYL